MEFQGQRGDAFSAWSVGKYAKRSATIHLNSKDLMREGAEHFNAHIVTQDANGIVFDDPNGVIRDKFAAEGFNGIVKYTDGIYEQDTVLGGLALRPASAIPGDTRQAGFFGADAVAGPPLVPGDGNTFTNLTQIAQRDVNVFEGPTTTDGIPALENDYQNNNGGFLPANTGNAIRALTARQDDLVDINGENVVSAQLRNNINTKRGNHNEQFSVLLPLAAFPQAKPHEISPGQHLRYSNVLSDNNTFREFLRQGNTGWRLELFYSADRRTNQGANKPAADNPVSNWIYLYSGTAHFSGTATGNPGLSGGQAMVKLILNKSPNLEALFNEAEYAPMRDDARGELQFAFTTETADGGGVLPNNARCLKQIHWNLRKMPSLNINAQNIFPSGQSHADYIVNIPNIIGYPEHKRCLVQLQSLSLFPTNEFAMTNLNHTTRPDEADQVCPVYVGVELQGVGGQNMFSTTGGTVRNTQLVGTCCLEVKGHRYEHIGGSGVDVGHRILSYGYDNGRSVLDDGVLINSPFGKSMRVRFLNLTTNRVLNTNTAGDYANNRDTQSDIINNPTQLTLRLLFLDDDELPMR